MGSWLDFDRGKALRATDINDMAQTLAAAAAYLGQLTQGLSRSTYSEREKADEPAVGSRARSFVRCRARRP